MNTVELTGEYVESLPPVNIYGEMLTCIVLKIRNMLLHVAARNVADFNQGDMVKCEGHIVTYRDAGRLQTHVCVDKLEKVEITGEVTTRNKVKVMGVVKKHAHISDTIDLGLVLVQRPNHKSLSVVHFVARRFNLKDTNLLDKEVIIEGFWKKRNGRYEVHACEIKEVNKESDETASSKVYRQSETSLRKTKQRT